MIKSKKITSEEILEQWRHGKSALDWRPLTPQEKREWLQACLAWTGLPDQKIKSFTYLLDGNQVNSNLDFYCLLGETFFGYRGYFGQDAEGFNDCFAEIVKATKEKETVEKGATIKIKNAAHVKHVLKDSFQYIIDSFSQYGFEVELD